MPAIKLDNENIGGHLTPLQSSAMMTPEIQRCIPLTAHTGMELAPSVEII